MRNNKKALYESIMSKVSRVVKQALNEGIVPEDGEYGYVCMVYPMDKFDIELSEEEWEYCMNNTYFGERWETYDEAEQELFNVMKQYAKDYEGETITGEIYDVKYDCFDGMYYLNDDGKIIRYSN